MSAQKNKDGHNLTPLTPKRSMSWPTTLLPWQITRDDVNGGTRKNPVFHNGKKGAVYFSQVSGHVRSNFPSDPFTDFPSTCGKLRSANCLRSRWGSKKPYTFGGCLSVTLLAAPPGSPGSFALVRTLVTLALDDVDLVEEEKSNYPPKN